jgi:phosphatidylserine synthase
MSIGAGIGFLFGIGFTIVSAFQFDETRTTAGETIAVGIFIGMPITVMMGTIAGWLWDIFFRERRE